MIEQIDEPAEWCFRLVIVPKPNGKIRMCVDITALNKGVESTAYHLPKVTKMLAMLAKDRVFSKLDANVGFRQVRFDPEGKRLT